MNTDFEDRLRAGLARDEVDVPLDLQSVLDEGREKVRGRRLGWTVAGLAALAVVASVVTPLVIAGTVPAVPVPVSSPTATATAAPSGLGDAVWRVAGLNGAKPSGSTPLTVQFANGTLYGYGGCNAFSALYEVSGDQFQRGTKVSVGAVGCSKTVSTQEEAFITALADARSVRTTGAGISLLGGDGASVLDLATFEPDGLTWRLTDLAGEKHGKDSAFTLVIDGDHVRGTTACGDFNADLTRNGSSWHVPGIWVKPAHSCPSTINDETAHFLAQLQRASTWSLTPTTLRLAVADGTALQFTFVAR